MIQSYMQLFYLFQKYLYCVFLVIFSFPLDKRLTHLSSQICIFILRFPAARLLRCTYNTFHVRVACREVQTLRKLTAAILFRCRALNTGDMQNHRLYENFEGLKTPKLKLCELLTRYSAVYLSPFRSKIHEQVVLLKFLLSA